jgi:hypothetical protein
VARIGRIVGGAVALVAITASSVALAADDPLLARIDFEDRETATADWSHVFEQAPGLPRRSLFFDAVVDESIAASGGSSLRFHLEGGSISYRMRPEAAIPIRLDADYRVSARVRTEDLRHATARLEIRVVDGRRWRDRDASAGDPVADATIALLHATSLESSAEGRWVDLVTTVRTEGRPFEDADDLRLFVALQVVQPGFDEHDSAAPEVVPIVRLEDIDGRAWFDEIEVRRSPRLRVTPSSASGIQRGEDAIEFEVVVDDPTGGIQSATVELQDIDGRIVDRRAVPVDVVETQAISLAADGPGWFEAVLRTRNLAGQGMERRHGVLVLPGSDSRSGRDAPRFGVSIARWTPETLESLDSTLNALDPDAVEISIWPEENDGRASLEGVEAMRRLLDRQRRAGREPMVAFDRLHGGLAATARVEPQAVRAALEDDGEHVWRRAIGDWMLRLGTSISRWRVEGDPDGSGAPELFRELARTFVADPVVLVGTGFESARSFNELEESCRIGTPDLGSRAQAELSSDDLAGATVLLAAPPEEWTVRDRIDAAARRAMAAWGAGVERTLLRWDPQASPDPALVAWAGLSRGLGSRQPAGEVRCSDTATCLVADGGHDAALVVWSDLVARTEVLRIPVGVEAVEVLELDGRRRRVAVSGGQLELEIGSTPRIVLGADRLPILIASEARFEPETLGLGRREHAVELVVRNPIEQPIDGELRFDPPPGWSIDPPRPRVRALAGELIRIPLSISWSGPQMLGTIDVPMRLDIRSPRPMRIPIDVPLVLESEALVVTADWSIARGGGDVGESPIILTVEIENVGTRTLDLELAVSAWRVGRERRTITRLAPGAREVRRLPIRAGFDRLAGTDLRVEVRELDGPESVALKIPLGGPVGITRTAVVPAP